MTPMRIPFALLLYVYLPLCGASVNDPQATSPAWELRHGAGKEAYVARDFTKAEKLFLDSFKLAVSIPEQGISANDLGNTLHNLNREKEAKLWLARSLQIWVGTKGYGDPAAHTAVGLADVMRGMGEYKEAEQVHLAALTYKDLRADTYAEVLNAHADLLRETGRFEDAYAMFQFAVRTPGASNRRKIDSLLGVGELGRLLGEREKAIQHLRQAADLAEATHADTLQAVAIRELGQAYMEERSFARAEPLFRRSLAILETADAPKQQVAITLACTGDLYRLEGKLALAEDAWSRTLEIEKATLGENHPQVGLVMEQLAELYSFEKRMDLAESYANGSYRIMSSTLGEESPAAAAALAAVALVEAREQHLQDSAKHYENSISILKQANLGNNVAIVAILDGYASVLQAMHRNREAKLVRNELKGIQVKNFAGR